MRLLGAAWKLIKRQSNFDNMQLGDLEKAQKKITQKPTQRLRLGLELEEQPAPLPKRKVCLQVFHLVRGFSLPMLSFCHISWLFVVSPCFFPAMSGGYSGSR